MTNQQELDGIYNNVCGASQLTFIDLICQRLLDTAITKQGGGTTSVRIETSWEAKNNANLAAQVTSLAGQVAALQTSINGTITTAVASAVAAHPVTATNTLDPATVTAIAEAVFQRLKAQVDKP